MATNQIAFIICTDDMMFYWECNRYIQDLILPEGYEKDVICIQEAESISEGYHAGMESSQAKYKVYVNQNTTILNQNLIIDFLDIFNKDAAIGMIGVRGIHKLPEDIGSSPAWDVGGIDLYDGRMEKNEESYQNIQQAGMTVAAIDDSLLITQYDIPWKSNETSNTSSHSISQSLAMRNHGYKIVVPYQEASWCCRDMNQISKYDSSDNLEPTKLLESVIQLWKMGMCEQVTETIEKLKEMNLGNPEIQEIINIIDICHLEKEHVDKTEGIFLKYSSWQDIHNLYTGIKFVLRRVEYQRSDDRIEELKQSMQNGEISSDAVRIIANAALIEHKRIYPSLIWTENPDKKEPLVTVITAVHNGADFIDRTIESVLNQDYKNFEFIIVDDASADNSRDVISKYQDKRIKTIFLEKGNHVCYAANTAFKESKGDYITLIGHDDIWKADKLKKQVDFMENHPGYGVCFTWASIKNLEGENLDKKYSLLQNKFQSPNYSSKKWFRKLFYLSNFFCCPTACIRRSLLKDTVFYRNALVQLQDYDLWLRLISKTSFYILQEKLVDYIQFDNARKNLSAPTNETITRTYQEEKWIQDNILENLSDQVFTEFFKEDFRYNAAKDRMLACEKAFILLNTNNDYGLRRFIELLNTEEYRVIFEEYYDFGLKDFYELNAKQYILEWRGNDMPE